MSILPHDDAEPFDELAARGARAQLELVRLDALVAYRERLLRGARHLADTTLGLIEERALTLLLEERARQAKAQLTIDSIPLLRDRMRLENDRLRRGPDQAHTALVEAMQRQITDLERRLTDETKRAESYIALLDPDAGGAPS
jgi:hypothetical protein